MRTPASPLSLPAVDPAIPGRFTIVSRSPALQNIATILATADILRPAHWSGGLSDSVARCFTMVAAEHLPSPLADYDLLLVEDTVKADLEYDSSHGYTDHYKLSKGTPVSALLLTFNNDHMVHRTIGPTLKRLEKSRPGLGQTVLYWLHAAYNKTARALDPIDGYQWAQWQYWGGEPDENMRMEEELGEAEYQHNADQEEQPPDKRTPFDVEAAKRQIEIFTKADYDRAIPPWAGTQFKTRPALSLATLTRLRLPPRDRKIIAAIRAIAPLLQKVPDHLHDTGRFEGVRWECSPYLFRWHCPPNRKSQDPLGQIYDDYMNDLMNAGDSLLDVNAVFAWHDDPSLVNAVQRFVTYLQLLRLADELLNTIAPATLP